MRRVAVGLLLLGLLQMAGDLLGMPLLRGIGAATGASPAPKVFSAVQGLETYSTRFYLEWEDAQGARQGARLTPQLYARLRGPYNRRNVYGAALAYGPVLWANPRSRPLFEGVATYALCGAAPLLRELEIGAQARPGSVRVRLEPLPGTDIGDLPRILHPPCPR